MAALFPQVNGVAVLTNINFENMAFAGAIQGLNFASKEVSPRWVYADTISWTRGAHAFKFGGEYRLSSTKSTLGGTVQAGANRPQVNSGNAPLAPVTGIARPGLLGTIGSGNQQVAQNMLTFLSGSLGSMTQVRFINDLSGTWNDFATDPVKIRDIAQNEIGTFFKDDWKVTRDLTLNLGVRWDYYGVPWERNGLTSSLTRWRQCSIWNFRPKLRRLDETGCARDLMEIIYVVRTHPTRMRESITGI